MVTTLEQRLAELRQEYGEDAYILANDGNDGYDILVWESEADSENDDGYRAIHRETFNARR